jgi:hypothetical protein
VNGWQAFRSGITLTLRYWQVVLILFVCNLLSALIAAALPALLVASGLGHRPAIHEAADGMDAWLVLEAAFSPLADMALEPQAAEPQLSSGLGPATLVGLLVALALPVLAWLPASFLSGGLLLTYVEALRSGVHDQGLRPFRWRRFVWGCWHWWGAFLLWGAVQALAFLGIMVPAIVLGVGAVAAGGRWVAWVVAPLLGLVAVLGLMLMEWTRILAVAGGTRNLFRAFGQAARFVLRRPLAVASLYGLSLLSVGALHAVYRLGLLPVLPLDWWPLVLIVQQSFVLARLGTRLARLAGGASLLVRSPLPTRGQAVASVGEP